MSGLGWYKTNDESGGGSTKDVIELTVDRIENGKPVYRDNRTVQKYYQEDDNGKFLNKFTPQYKPSY